MDTANEPEPVNETPAAVKDAYLTVLEFLQSYGWFLLLGLIVALYFKRHIKQAFFRWRSGREQETNYHRYDSDTILSRQQAMEESRRRMQEKFDADAARHAEETRVKEEEKRKKRIEDWERHQQGKGYRSKYKPPEEGGASASGGSAGPGQPKKKTTYKPSDYNPLTGDSSSGSSGFRPSRRSGNGGGGG